MTERVKQFQRRCAACPHYDPLQFTGGEKVYPYCAWRGIYYPCSGDRCNNAEAIHRHYMAVLLQANRYRRDQHVPSIYRMPNPTELGLAIDYAVRRMKGKVPKPFPFMKDEFRMAELLETRIEDLGLSARPYNCLKHCGIATLGDLVQYDRRYLLKLRNLGSASISEIECAVEERGLSFSMDVAPLIERYRKYKQMIDNESNETF